MKRTDKLIENNFVNSHDSNLVIPSTHLNYQEIFEVELCEIYWIEKEILKMTYRLIPQFRNSGFSSSLINYCRVSQLQIRRLEWVFKSVSKITDIKYCGSIADAFEEIKDSLNLVYSGFNAEPDFFSAAQKILDYTVDSYLVLISTASSMGNYNIANKLKKNISEVRKAQFWIGTYSKLDRNNN